MSEDDAIVVTTVDDALVRDGHMLVLVGSEVMLLSAVSSEIVRVAATGVTVAALGAHLLRTFGPPPSGTSVPQQTRVMVERLREARIVHVTGG